MVLWPKTTLRENKSILWSYSCYNLSGEAAHDNPCREVGALRFRHAGGSACVVTRNTKSLRQTPRYCLNILAFYSRFPSLGFPALGIEFFLRAVRRPKRTARSLWRLNCSDGKSKLFTSLATLHKEGSAFHRTHSEAVSHSTIWTAAVSGVNSSSCVSSHDDTAGLFSHPVILTANTHALPSTVRKLIQWIKDCRLTLGAGELTEVTHTDRPEKWLAALSSLMGKPFRAYF